MPWAFPAGPPMVGDSRRLALRIHVPDADVTKTLVFDALMTVGQACDQIRHQIREIDGLDNPKDYGLFLPHEDNKKGLWLDNSRSLEHYILRNGDIIEYKYRFRWLYIRTMDGTRKTLRVDDSKTLAELMLPICTKMGIYNYEEYLLVRNTEEAEKDRGVTLKRAHHQTGGLVGTLRDADKMEKLRKELHTDDEVIWLNPAQSLRQQGIDEKEILLLRRRYFFSDMNVDARDPVQLNLLYVQLKDAILNGTHPVTLEEAVTLAALQCQVELGNFNPNKFRSGYLDIKDYLPKEFLKVKNVEKKIFQQHATLNGLSDIEARVKYCHFCRSLKTYGITFFLVKEKMKGKNRLVPRLLGITKDSVVRLDERTKEVVKVWPLTSILKWAASPNAFTMDFGEYSPDEYYTAQTAEGEQISQLIAGYIDIILKKQKARDHQGLQGDEEAAMYEENVRAERAKFVHTERRSVGPADRMRVQARVEETIEKQRLQQPQQALPPLLNGTAQQMVVNDDDNNMVGYIGTSERRYIQAGSIPTLSSEIGRIKVDDTTDDFITGGTQYYVCKTMTPAQRALHVTIEENINALEEGKQRLDIGPPAERVLANLGHDEASRRWLDESMGVTEVRVADEMGAMNAAVAQAVRSANRADSAGGGVHFGVTEVTDPSDDLMRVQQSFRVVTVHFPAFVDNVKRVAVLRRESGLLRAEDEPDERLRLDITDQSEANAQNLLGAARTVADSFTELLKAATPLTTRQTDYNLDTVNYVTEQGLQVAGSSRKAILEAANRVGEASNDFLRYVLQDTEVLEGEIVPEVDERAYQADLLALYQDKLLELAKEVANSTAVLVVKAKNLATQTSLDLDHQQLVVMAATNTGLCTSQLVACTKVLAPTIHQASCQQQLSESTYEVATSVDDVVRVARGAGQAAHDTINPSEPEVHEIDSAVMQVESAATEVRTSLDRLNAHLLRGSIRPYQGDTLDLFQQAYDELRQETDGVRLVAAARRLSQVTAQMISDLKMQAETVEGDPERQTRLFAAAKQLADATTELINQAKICSSNPDSLTPQADLKHAADNLVVVAYASAAELLNARVIRSLQAAARAVVSASNNLITTSRYAANKSRANNYHILINEKTVSDLLPKIVSAIRFIRRDPEDPLAQLELICACENAIQPCNQLARSCRSMVPTIGDPAVQSALDNSTSQMVVAVETLKACLARVSPIARQLQMDGALASLLRTVREAEELEDLAKAGTLTALPDDKVEDRYRILKVSIRDARNATNEVTSAVDSLEQDYAAPQSPNCDQGEDWLGSSANRLAGAMSDLSRSIRSCLVSEDRPIDSSGAFAARTAAQLAYQLVCEARKLEALQPTVSSPDQQADVLESNRNVAINCKLIGDNLNCALLECLLKALPGQKELSEASDLVGRRRKDLVRFADNPTVFEYPIEETRVERTQTEFAGAAVEFNQATADLTSCYTPSNFRRSSVRFAGAYDSLVNKGLQLSRAKSPKDPTGPQLITGLVEVSDRSSEMLEDAKQVCSQPEAEPLRQKLHLAARSVTDSISHILSISVSGVVPGVADCDAELRRLEAMRPLLEYPGRPTNQHTYQLCVSSFAQSLAPLSDGIRGTLDGVRSHNTEVFTSNIRKVTDCLCHVVEETSQAAYLIGVAHPTSEPGRGGPVDIAFFERLQRDIKNICRAMKSPEVTERQVVNLANDMSANVRSLHDACNTIAAQASNQEARRRLQNLADDSVKSMSELIQHSADWSDEGRRITANNIHAVNGNIDRLVSFITSISEFGGEPARISSEARSAQQPICLAGQACLESGRGVILASKHMLQTAETSGEPSNTAFGAFTAASRDLTDNTKHLLAVLNEQGPGQAECQRTLLNIRRLLHELERDKMAMMDGVFTPRHDSNEEGFLKQLTISTRAVRDMATSVGRGATSEAERLGHAVRELDLLLPGLVSSALGAASRAPNSSAQLIYVEHTRTVLESVEQLISAAKQAGGNPRSDPIREAVDDGVKAQIDSCEELLSAIEGVASQQSFLAKLMAVLEESRALVDKPGRAPYDAHFTDYQSRLLRLARHMEQQTEATVRAARRPQESTSQEMTGLVQNLAQDYAEICMISRDACETLRDPHEAEKLRWAVKNLGQTTRGLIMATVNVSSSRPDPSFSRGSVGPKPPAYLRSLDFSAGAMNDRLRELIALLEMQGPGTQACLQGASTVSGIIADLDTTILFASSGTLHPPIRDDADVHQLEAHHRYSALSPGYDDFGREAQGNFISIRESIHRTADALVQDTRSLVMGAGEDQTRLAGSTQKAVRNISQLADVVKQGAALIGPGQSDSQVLILGAAKDAAVALRSTLLAASQVQGRPKTDPAFKEMEAYEGSVESSVTFLLKSVDSIDMESTRGTKALIATAHLCRQLANRMPSSAATAKQAVSLNDLGSATTLLSTTSSLVSRYLAPDELSRATEGPLRTTMDRAMATASTRRQDDALIFANTARHAVVDLVNACKNLQRQPEIKEEFRKGSSDTVRKVVLETAELLDAVKCVIAEANPNDLNRVSASAGKITTMSSQLMRLIDRMRDNPRLVMYFRVSNPEWRDVAEKYLGRHIAFHHHYESCSDYDGSYRATSSQISCLQSQLDSTGRLLTGNEAALEASRRIDVALGLLEGDFYQSMQRTTNQDVVHHTQPILSMARAVTLATREFVQTVQLASTSKAAANFGRLDLSVALATEQLCELTRLCSETRSEGPYTAPLDDPVRVMPSRERLLNAVRQVATASGELLYAVQSNSQITSANMTAVQTAARAVKEQTDKMSTMVRNKDPIFSHLPSQSGLEASIATPIPIVSPQQEDTNSSAQIHTEQEALDDLQNEVERLNRNLNEESGMS
ncbi:talin [Echinococcus multilocularis]|uniref:Talin n=1 Tax=Echinococcus multilocularis TaxID=6211 RepID=A0A068Y4U8_ECHMU|nr:talin [Echinococcus multilocularis]